MAIDFVQLTRDCRAVRIPGGEEITLPAGSDVYLTQSLGGSFTVQSRSHGGLFQIAGGDADALGQEAPADATPPVAGDAAIEERVNAALRTCYDPEIPVNIVDLGLVYDTRITAAGDDRYRVDVKMTLTATGCGMGAAIAADAEDKIRGLPQVDVANVEIVWDPPWNPRMISEEGRKKLGM